MDYKEEQNGEIEALLSIYEGELDGNLEKITYVIYYIENIKSSSCLTLITIFIFLSSSDRTTSYIYNPCEKRQLRRG